MQLSDPDGPGVVAGLARGSPRLLLHHEFALGPRASLGSRLGLVLGGPPQDELSGQFEARVGYSLGAPGDVLRSKLFGGLAVTTVTASVEVQADSQIVNGEPRTVDAWVEHGWLYLTFGAGLACYPFYPFGVELELPVFLGLAPELAAVSPTLGLVVEY